MADGTPIEWTDATWQIVTGCSVVSPGCTNCYAMRLAGTRMKHHPSRKGLTIDTKGGPVWNGQVRFNADQLTQPLRWKRPRRIFVAAHGDLFHEGVTDAQLDQIFAVMALCPQHTFQVLTKRPERMRAYLSDHCLAQRVMSELPTAFPMPLWTGFEQKSVMLARQRATRARWSAANTILSEGPLPNVCLGVSVEDQARADERIPPLLETPAAVRWISAEPLLGPLDLEPWLAWTADYLGDDWWGCGSCDEDCPTCPRRKAVYSYPEGPPDSEGVPTWIREDRHVLDWVVVGGESGPGSRPMHPDWARRLRDQCKAAEVPFFFKQWGEWAPTDSWRPGPGVQIAIMLDGSPVPDDVAPQDVGGHRLALDGKKTAGRLLDGQLHDGMPDRGGASNG